MTRMHFRAIADAILEARDGTETAEGQKALDRLSVILALEVLRFNAGFDKERFLTAAGYYDNAAGYYG